MKNSKQTDHDGLMKIYGQKPIKDSNGKYSYYNMELKSQFDFIAMVQYLAGKTEELVFVDWNSMQGHNVLYNALRIDWKSIIALNSEKKAHDWCKSLYNTMTFERKHNVNISFINKKPEYYKKPGDVNLFLSLFFTQSAVHDVWNKMSTGQMLITNCCITLKGAQVIETVDIKKYGTFSEEQSQKFPLFIYRKGPFKYQHLTSRLGFKGHAAELSDPITHEKAKMAKEWKKRSRK
jgi:hypothetical protein